MANSQLLRADILVLYLMFQQGYGFCFFKKDYFCN